MKLASIGAEVSRVRECAGAPHRVAEAALWLASRDLGEPRPLGDFLRCSKADKSAVKRAAWRLNEAARAGGLPLRTTSRWWRLGRICRLPW